MGLILLHNPIHTIYVKVVNIQDYKMEGKNAVVTTLSPQ